MPAVITHDTFGREVYESLHRIVGGSRDELHAFLLGNQGPDVLFFGALDPRTARIASVGSRMHRESPMETLAAFRAAVEDIVPEDIHDAAPGAPDAGAHAIARAYLLGLLCHYLLDSRLHPFIYAQEHAICDAGVDGLTRADGHEVHAAIESELDEMVLFTKRDLTIAEMDPSRRLLQGSDHVLNIISALYRRVVMEVFDERLPRGAYRIAAKGYRRALSALWSPRGMKRRALGRIEELFRRYSFARAMSHRNRKATTSIFDNREHAEWFDENRARKRTESFWDLYDEALQEAYIDVPEFAVTTGVEAFLRRVTGGRNYNGAVAEAIIVSAETL